jgi:drug/metabolite transporter (DMT)-like permease
MQSHSNRLAEGLFFGFLGVLTFSFTLPATRIAAPQFGGFTVGMGRAVIAGLLAAAVLLYRREHLPREHLRSFFLVGLGVILGFPLLTSLALTSSPAIHGAVINGLLPAATAVVAVWMGQEKPPRVFWIGVIVGVIGILIFAISEGGGHLQGSDILFVGAVILGAIGYAEGGKLARSLGGWRVICWALVLAWPLSLFITLISLQNRTLVIDTRGWLSFAYVSVFSAFLGFFVWYRGLAAGGIARISQVQLLQPFLAITWAALLLDEQLHPTTLFAAVIVVISVAISTRARLQAQAPR